jgi:outer membrane protein TolC
MKRIVYSLVFIAFCNTLTAQSDTLKLSLNQAIQYGIDNRLDIKANDITIAIAENTVVKSKKELIPDISANGKLTYYGQLQPSIIPAGYLGFTEPEKITIGMKNNTAFALDLNYAVFSPGLYTNIKISSNNLALEKERNVASKINSKIEIAEAYENVLLKSLQLAIAGNNENRYKNYYELVQGTYNNGALLESDLLLADLDYKNAKANTEKQKQNYLLSLQNLKYRINVADQSIVIITDSLQISSSDVNEALLSKSGSNRTEIKQLQIEQQGYELQLKKAIQYYLPSVSLFANYTDLFQGNRFEYSENFNWAPVNYVGLRITVPLTSSIKNNNTVKECRFKVTQNDLLQKQKAADVQYQILDAVTKLNNAKQNLTVSQNNYTLSQKVYDLKQQQYNGGSFSYVNLLDTEKSLNNAEQEYITSVYNYLIAKIYYKNTFGDY